jgi:hypothetical protein
MASAWRRMRNHEASKRDRFKALLKNGFKGEYKSCQLVLNIAGATETADRVIVYTPLTYVFGHLG